MVDVKPDKGDRRPPPDVSHSPFSPDAVPTYLEREEFCIENFSSRSLLGKPRIHTR